MRIQHLGLLCLSALTLSSAGCALDSEWLRSDDEAQDQAAASATEVRMDIHVVDAWGRDLEVDDSTKLSVTLGARTTTQAVPRARVSLTGSGDLVLSAASRDYLPLSVKLRYDGKRQRDSLAKLKENHLGTGVVIGHTYDRQRGTTYHVYLGLPHRFFASSAPAFSSGNDVRFLQDGEAMWGSVHGDLLTARKNVHVSTWWWESDFELVRPSGQHPTMTESARRENTILRILERSPAHKRVLVGQFFNQDGSLSGMTTDAGLNRYAEAANDRFEMMGQANPTRGLYPFYPNQDSFLARVLGQGSAEEQTFLQDDWLTVNLAARTLDLNAWPIRLPVPHASIHQKFMVIDDRLAYVGGANFRPTDWDTSAHLLHEPRRTEFKTPKWQREAIARGEFISGVSPRKDYMVRIDGPAVKDVAEVFEERWELLRSNRVRHSENATPFSVSGAPNSHANGVKVQITTTMPAPNTQTSIAESWLNAVGQAQNYIYIEDQYFRAPILVEAIKKRMSEVPGLQLVVITKPVSKTTDPGCEWTHRTSEDLKNSFGARYHLFQLRTWGMQYYDPTEQEETLWGWSDSMKSRFEDIDVHSKMLIVDDRFMSIGSANKNNRGMLFEAEMNAAIYDAKFVTQARRKILANLLPSGTVVPNDAPGWVGALKSAARVNDQVESRWKARDYLYPLNRNVSSDLTPRGFVYSLTFDTPRSCLLNGVGPDMT